MIVIHALWPAGSRLCLWAEDPHRPGTALPRRGRPPRYPRPRPHPFACEVSQLLEVVNQLVGPEPAPVEDIELDILLPSSRDAPGASPHLLRDESVESAPLTGVAPWSVPATALATEHSLDLLLSLPRGNSPGVRVDDSVWFFLEVAQLALELVARGRVLPTLEERGERWAARWRPAPATAADAARFELLVTAMPVVCRAEYENEASREGRPPHAVLHDSLGSLVDACARDALERRTLVPPRRGRRRQPQPLHEVWRGGLAAGEPWVDGDPYELELLQKELDEWAYPLWEVSDREFRTCFRLSEPEALESRVGLKSMEGAQGGEGPWRLEILLQGTDDPSLLVPAEDVWAADGVLNAFRKSIEGPHELLLEDLGRALRLYPGLEPALHSSAPTGIDLDAGGAHDFLTGAAAPLEQAGFGVLVPRWWGRRDATLGLKLNLSYKDEANVAHKPLLGTDGLCKYRWRVAIGDEELTLAELRRLAAVKWPLVKVRGRWVELRSEDLEAALGLFKRGADKGEMSLGDAMRTGLGLGESPAGLPVRGIQAKGRLNELFAPDGDSRVAVMATPEGFQGELRPYQERGLGWLWFLDRLGLGACLADDMGLGKTAQLLALLVAERKAKVHPRPGPSLVVCPMSVVGNWQREAQRFVPLLDVHVHHGERLNGRAFARAVKASDLVVTTYATATRDIETLETVNWERVVLDEAQNIKTSAAKQTQAMRALNARSRVALTGTPVENRLSELWSILEFLNPGLLGSAQAFKENFAVPIERYHDDEAADKLKRITGPFVLRRLKSDKAIIKDLPDKFEMKVFCNLTREQATLYQAVVDDMLGKVDASEGMARKGMVLSTILKLKQVCNHPTQFLKDRSKLAGRSGKLQRLEEILEEVLSEGDKALCFTQFAALGHMLKAHLQDRFGRETLFLHGGTSKKMRDDMVARFQQDSGPSLLLVSLKAGGTGLNLTAANHVIHFDRWWNPAVEDQATDRAFRIGQTRNVQVRKFICTGTLEERIDMMIERKKVLAQRIVGAGESWLTELSTAELRDVVALAADAVAG